MIPGHKNSGGIGENDFFAALEKNSLGLKPSSPRLASDKLQLILLLM